MRAAISKAISRKHDIVTADDMLAAQEEYAEFASGVLAVEAGVSLTEFEEYMLSFYGSRSVLSESDVSKCLVNAGAEPNDIQRLLEMLVSLSFLGASIQDANFQYAEDLLEFKRLLMKARRFADERQSPVMFQINPVFWRMLSILDGDPNQTKLQFSR